MNKSNDPVIRKSEPTILMGIINKCKVYLIINRNEKEKIIFNLIPNKRVK